MVQFKNIRATVIRYDDKEPYPEYKLTRKATTNAQTLKETYVEVVSGERFAVVVEILPGFDFQSAPDVRTSFSADGMRPTNFCISKKNVTKGRGAAAIKRRRRIWEDYTRKTEGMWKECGLVFADLQLDEDAEPAAEQVAHEVDMYGKITIEVQCGTRTFHKRPLGESAEIQEAYSASKDVVKKSHISNTVKMLDLGKLDDPPVRGLFTPAKGESSAPLQVNLLYRSRSALELLKVIPETSIAPTEDLSPSATGDNLGAATGTKRKARGSSLEASDDAQQPAPKPHSAPGLPLDVGSHSEKPALGGHSPPHSPLDVVGDAGQLPHKKHEARGLPLIVGGGAVQPPPKKARKGYKVSDLTVIKGEDDDEDLVIVSAGPASRVQPTETHAQAQVSVAPAQQGDQAKRERKKALLNKRLEQLKIEREQLKIEQELLEMED